VNHCPSQFNSVYSIVHNNLAFIRDVLYNFSSDKLNPFASLYVYVVMLLLYRWIQVLHAVRIVVQIWLTLLVMFSLDWLQCSMWNRAHYESLLLIPVSSFIVTAGGVTLVQKVEVPIQKDNEALLGPKMRGDEVTPSNCVVCELSRWSPGQKRFYCNLISKDRRCWQRVTANSSPFRPEK